MENGDYQYLFYSSTPFAMVMEMVNTLYKNLEI